MCQRGGGLWRILVTVRRLEHFLFQPQTTNEGCSPDRGIKTGQTDAVAHIFQYKCGSGISPLIQIIVTSGSGGWNILSFKALKFLFKVSCFLGLILDTFGLHFFAHFHALTIAGIPLQGLLKLTSA